MSTTSDIAMSLVSHEDGFKEKAEEDGMDDVARDGTTGRREKYRNLSAYWLFGLCNNYAYVIMLSSAYDILKSETAPPPPPSLVTPTSWQNLTNSSKPENPYECNKASTAIVLLADVVPAILIKYTSPWFAELVPFDVRIAFCIMCTCASFLIVALSHSVPFSLIGVACASAASGLGEFTFLSLAAFYDKNVVSVWSSGTGAAGLFGALSYAGLTSVGLSPRNTILVMLVIPVLLAGSYWLLLVRLPHIHTCTWGRRLHDEYTTLPATEPEEGPQDKGDDPVEDAVRLPVKEKLEVIKSVLHLIIPLALVYIAEYVINQGLYELVYFTDIWLSHEDQYRWFQVIYQLGVFISRSSVNLILIRKTWILAILQIINMVIFVTHLLYFYIPSIYVVFVLILYEGLLGGAAYVNTFYIIRTDTAADQKEFAMGVTSLSDSTGIAIAAAIAVPVHQAFCSMKF